MKQIAILFLAVVLASCGSGYHLRKMEKHKAAAIRKGAKVSYDTVIRPITFTIPKTDFKVKLGDITIKTLTTDTIIVPGKQGEAKVRIDTVTNTVFVQCPEEEVTKDTAVAVTETIKAGHGFGTDLIIVLVSAVLGAIAMYIYRSKRNFTVIVSNQKTKE